MSFARGFCCWFRVLNFHGRWSMSFSVRFCSATGVGSFLCCCHFVSQTQLFVFVCMFGGSCVICSLVHYCFHFSFCIGFCCAVHFSVFTFASRRPLRRLHLARAVACARMCASMVQRWLLFGRKFWRKISSDVGFDVCFACSYLTNKLPGHAW